MVGALLIYKERAQVLAQTGIDQKFLTSSAQYSRNMYTPTLLLIALSTLLVHVSLCVLTINLNLLRSWIGMPFLGPF